jgi:glucose/arabinose dehydrogenase
MGWRAGATSIFCCLTLVACDKKTTPAPPVIDVPAGSETINGTERLGWDQRAADAVDLGTISYAIYVDGTRATLPGVTCAAAASSTGFSCSARLPTLAAGAHTLELASFVTDGGVLESARSAQLRVTVVPAVAGSGGSQTASSAGELWSSGIVSATADGVRIRVELVTDGLAQPTDLAFAPDGRLFVAESRGRIRILRDGHLLPDPAASLSDVLGDEGRLLALAFDPQFGRTRHVFAIYTAASRSGDRMFHLARFREVSGTLGDRATLIDGVPASAAPRASLRFGPDGKLYAAFDDGGDARRAGDMGSWNGKILRLNVDGTTPDDQAGATPVYADGHRSPAGLDWDPRSATLWAVDAAATSASQLRAVQSDPDLRAGKIRGILRGAYALPPAAPPASVAFYRERLFPAFVGSLFVASDEGRSLLRVQLDPPASTQPVIVERLLQNRVGGLRVVSVGPDGAIYFATATALGRLVPGR